MSVKNYFLSIICFPLLFTWIWAQPRIDVVYPRDEDGDGHIYMREIDSTFIFGSVFPSKSKLEINGLSVDIYKNGAFLAFVTVPRKGPFDLCCVASLNGAADTVWVSIERLQPEPEVMSDSLLDSLTIMGFDSLLVDSVFPGVVFPRLAEFIRPYNVVQTHPEGVYYFFPLKGTRALVWEAKEDFYRLELSPTEEGWAHGHYLSLRDSLEEIPVNFVDDILVKDLCDRTRITFLVEEKPLFRVDQDPELKTLTLTFYRTRAATNIITYDFQNPQVSRIKWEQPGQDVYRLVIKLNHRQPWGYRTEYQNGRFILDLRKPPIIHRHVLEGRKICIDPGHGGEEDGAIGPTRLLEKDINLAVSLSLRKMLERRGAQVVLTREGDRDMGLYERVAFADSAGADLLISIHHNALPDGINPFINHGSGTYYYQPQSLPLARAIHKNLLKTLKLNDYGLYYDNLALCRPTWPPAVLVEAAFMMYPPEEELLKKKRFQKRIARAVYRGIVEFLNECREE
ncbi:N-acetylmuramoyl-L-alanine amidase [candidate division KSB1 bacterium]|nr:N-acetylmuramoyl-L-alanine amidase [candidate division KSB1 bacterium]